MEGFDKLSQVNVRQTYDIRAITLVITQITFTCDNLSQPSITYHNSECDQPLKMTVMFTCMTCNRFET